MGQNLANISGYFYKKVMICVYFTTTKKQFPERKDFFTMMGCWKLHLLNFVPVD